MPLIIPSNSISAGGFAVDNSLRFDSGSSDYLNRTPSSTTNRRTFTISFWIKTSTFAGTIFSTGDYGAGDGYFQVRLLDSGRLALDDFDQSGNSYNVRWVTPSTTVFRDPSAWYHMVISVDSTQATLSDRVNFYLNGENIDSLFVDNASGSPSQNADFHINYDKVHQIGRDRNNTDYFNGYISEFVLIDGQQLDPTSFGEFDEDSGIWKPIDVSELTFGTNGFYLDFENSGSLGADVSGNGNNFTVNNLTAIDQTTDTPTNNFATLNGLAIGIDATLSEGNLKMSSGTATSRSGTASSIGFSQGKWFAEFKSAVSSTNSLIGIAGTTQNRSATDDDDIGNYPGRTQQGYGYAGEGNVYHNSLTVSGTFASFTTSDTIGVAVYLYNYLLYFYKNGVIQNSGTGIDISGITPQSGNWFFAVGDGSGATAVTIDCNFGNPPYTISSGNTDGNDYGNFEYAVPSGYLSLCTKNLSEVLG